MRFHEATAPAIRNLDGESTMLVLPLAAVEQHGPNMPTGTDTIICGAVAEAADIIERFVGPLSEHQEQP